MQRAKVTVKTRKKVWRISPATPLGEFVDPSVQPETPSFEHGPDQEERHQGWAVSSFELLNGVEISEGDSSTVPAELFDELFKAPKKR